MERSKVFYSDGFDNTNCRKTTVCVHRAQRQAGYTNQRDYSYIGLMDYDARWYSPTLGCFTQPDSIVPDAGNPQSLNRFSYVGNRPIILIDPSGHICYDPDIDAAFDCGGNSGYASVGQDYYSSTNTFGVDHKNQYGISQVANVTSFESFEELYGVTLNDSLSDKNKGEIAAAVRAVAGARGDLFDGENHEAFRSSFGGVTFSGGAQSNYWCVASQYSNSITCNGSRIHVTLIVHELGHILDFNTQASNSLLRQTLSVGGKHITGINVDGVFQRTNRGYQSGSDCPVHAYNTCQWHPLGMDASSNTIWEDFADMFFNWVYGSFSDDAYGNARNNWMTTNMGEWIP